MSLWKSGVVAVARGVCSSTLRQCSRMETNLPWRSNLTLRSRVDAPGYGAYRVIETRASWSTAETAIIVCDMWDLHHCLNATRRGRRARATDQ